MCMRPARGICRFLVASITLGVNARLILFHCSSQKFLFFSLFSIIKKKKHLNQLSLNSWAMRLLTLCTRCLFKLINLFCLFVYLFVWLNLFSLLLPVSHLSYCTHQQYQPGPNWIYSINQSCVHIKLHQLALTHRHKIIICNGTINNTSTIITSSHGSDSDEPTFYRNLFTSLQDFSTSAMITGDFNSHQPNNRQLNKLTSYHTHTHELEGPESFERCEGYRHCSHRRGELAWSQEELIVSRNELFELTLPAGGGGLGRKARSG